MIKSALLIISLYDGIVNQQKEVKNLIKYLTTIFKHLVAVECLFQFV